MLTVMRTLKLEMKGGGKPPNNGVLLSFPCFFRWLETLLIYCINIRFTMLPTDIIYTLPSYFFLSSIPF